MRPVDADALMAKLNRKKAGPANQRYTEGFNDCLMRVRSMVHSAPTLTPPNEALTWEELKAETKTNPVYSIKYGWIFPSAVKDEPYKQIWFFTSKGFAHTELFYRDTFYRRPPEGEEDT